MSIAEQSDDARTCTQLICLHHVPARPNQPRSGYQYPAHDDASKSLLRCNGILPAPTTIMSCFSAITIVDDWYYVSNTQSLFSESGNDNNVLRMCRRLLIEVFSIRIRLIEVVTLPSPRVQDPNVSPPQLIRT